MSAKLTHIHKSSKIRGDSPHLFTKLLIKAQLPPYKYNSLDFWPIAMKQKNDSSPAQQIALTNSIPSSPSMIIFLLSPPCTLQMAEYVLLEK